MTDIRMTPEAQKRVIRMNLMSVWVIAGLFALVQAPLQFLLENWVMGATLIGIAIAMVVATYALAKRMGERSRITFGDGTYTVHGAFRSKTFTAADVARVVTIDRMALSGGIAGTTHHLIVTGPVKRLLMLVGQMWGTDQLSALALDLSGRGVPLTPIPNPITPVELRAYDARLMPAWQAHPYAFGLLYALGALLLAVIVIVLAFVFVLPVFFGY